MFYKPAEMTQWLRGYIVHSCKQMRMVKKNVDDVICTLFIDLLLNVIPIRRKIDLI